MKKSFLKLALRKEIIMELQYINNTDNNVFTTVSFSADDMEHTDKLCECKIDVDPETKTWTF